MTAPLDPRIREISQQLVDVYLEDYEKNLAAGNLTEEMISRKEDVLIYMAWRSVNSAFSERGIYFRESSLYNAYQGIIHSSEIVSDGN